MRIFKFALYILLIIVLQSVVFSRLNLWGASPDLVLISVIIFSVLGAEVPALLFAALSGFLQDIFSFGLYFNTISKVVISKIVSILRESFIGDRYSLAFGLVAVFTPLSLMGEGVVFWGKDINLVGFSLKLLLTTLYNLVLVPICYFIINKLGHE